MLNGWWKGEPRRTGTAIWKARQELAAGRIDAKEFMDIACASAPSVGHCKHLGTASTMNALAEALGMRCRLRGDPGAAYRERGQIAYDTGVRAVEIVHDDLRPSDILTRKAFENSIVANSAIGGSTNAPIHINAIAGTVGVKLRIEDWETVGYDVPLLVNMQPAGKVSRRGVFPRRRPAGGDERVAQGQAHPRRRADHQRQDHGRERQVAQVADPTSSSPTAADEEAGRFKVLKGNLFDSAIMKTSVISDDFRKRFCQPEGPNAFEGRAVVFDGPEDYHHRIDDPSLKIDDRTILFMRGAGRDRLSGFCRSREYATAGSADQKGHHGAALHRRRAAVRHLGVAVHFECFARSSGQRRAGALEDRRPCAHRPQQGHGQYSCFKG
jgi:dihydroxy-acid dehydratase